MKNFALLVPGVIFGVGLAVSGLTNPAKVVNFLDVAGKWDPSLLFTMGGAVMVFAALNVFVHKRAAPIFGGKFPGVRGSTKLDPRLFVGAAAFGIGWGLSGVCPGPAITDVSHLRGEVFTYLGSMAVGMVLAQHVFGADAPAAPEAESEAAPPEGAEPAQA